MPLKQTALKCALLGLCGLSLSVQAEQITVNVTAIVNQIDDYSGVVSDIAHGDVITGTYVYYSTLRTHNVFELHFNAVPVRNEIMPVTPTLHSSVIVAKR